MPPKIIIEDRFFKKQKKTTSLNKSLFNIPLMAADFSDTEEILGLDQSIRFGQKRSREESKESAIITFFGSTSSSEFQIQFPPSPKARV